jgi:drug/metabolite transporter (DMT)-like permease
MIEHPEFIFILIAIIGAAAYGLSAVIDSHLLNQRFKYLSALLFFILLITPVFNLLLLPFESLTLPSVSMLPAYIALGVLYFLLPLLIFFARRQADTSIVGALGNMSKILLPILALVFFNEYLQIQQYLGFFLILVVSITLCLNNDGKGLGRLRLNRSFWLMLLAAAVGTASILLEKYILVNDSNWFNLVVYSSVASAIAALFMLFPKRTRQDIAKSAPLFRKYAWILIISGALSFLGNASGILALSELPVLVKTGLSATEPLFILLFGILAGHFFHKYVKESVNQKDLRKKILCYVLLVIGLILLNIKG